MITPRWRQVITTVMLLVIGGGLALAASAATNDDKGEHATMLMVQLAAVEEAYYQAIAPRGAQGDLGEIAARYKTLVKATGMMLEQTYTTAPELLLRTALQTQLFDVHSRALERLHAIAELQELQRQTGGGRRAKP